MMTTKFIYDILQWMMPQLRSQPDGIVPLPNATEVARPSPIPNAMPGQARMQPMGRGQSQNLPPFQIPGMNTQMDVAPRSPDVSVAASYPTLPPFQFPGFNLPFGSLMPASPVQQAQPQAQPQSMPQPATMPMTTEPTPQIDADAIKRAQIEALRRKASPWATNFGGYNDQNQ